MKRILLLLLAGCLLTILGCAGAAVKTDSQMNEQTLRIAGKYLNPFTADIYLELLDDGTFHDIFGKRTAQGKYTVAGNTVKFTLENGRTFECTIDGNSLVTKEGIKYTKR